MTIYLYSGTPGSGKSLDAAKTIRYWLKHGKPVIANFEVNHDEIRSGRFTYMPNSCFSVDDLVLWASDWWSDHDAKEDGILLVLDECQLIFNSRTWQDRDRLKVLEFLSQHRKYKYKIILIAQSSIMIDRQFRVLIEYEVKHRKVSNIGLFGKMLSLLSFSELFRANTYLYQTSEFLSGEFFRFSKKDAAIYDSYSAFEGKGTAQAVPVTWVQMIE